MSDDRRGVTPAVGKSLEIGLVVLFVALVTTSLLGLVVPEYRAATNAELGERVLVAAGQEVEDAIPPNGTAVERRTTVELPATIGGQHYEIVTDGRALVLDHPDDEVDGRIELALPPRVDDLDGTWQSGAQTVVHVRDESDGLVVELRNGGDP